ncbi:MAG TPA: FG-GAP-like repeat-containing protein [Cyclobacteriaceae bacterium]|nr:FG-GAP-like repeat-containing protein [Cyclobacteriaceae bacterium]
MRYFYTLLLTLCVSLAAAPAFSQITSWAKKSGPYGGSISDLEFDVAKSKAYAIVENKLYYSSDDGTTWNRASIADNYLYDVEVASNGTVYVTDGYSVYTSTDGINFTEKTEDNVMSAAYKIRRLSTGSLVALSSSRLYFSNDDGKTWVGGASGSFRTAFIAINSSDNIFVISNTTGLPVRSIDGGVSVAALTNTNISAGGTVFNVANRNDRGAIFCVNATGIWTSSNGDTWTSIKGGLIVDATIASASAYPSFIEFSADGLGMYFIDNLNSKMYYKTATGAASSWAASANFPGGTGTPIATASAKTLVAASPGTSIAIFGNTSGVIKTTTGTSSFVSNANTGLSEVDPTQVISTYDGNILVDTYNAGLQISEDRGATWARNTSIPLGALLMTTTSSTSTRNHDVLVLNNYPDYDLYRSTNSGITFAKQTTPVDFQWIQGTDFDHVFALSYSPGTTWYYSYSNGATGTWTASNITITNLPASFAIYSPERMSVYSTSVTSSTMFFELYNNNTPGYEQWKVVFTIGATTTISGVASKVTLPFADMDKMKAAAGKFYVFSDNTNPDKYAYSINAGSTWTTRNSPAVEGEMFVADNGYVFLTSESPSKVYVTRDDGVSYIEATLPSGSTVSTFNINDIYIDALDFAHMLVYRDYLYSTTNEIVLPVAPTNGAVLGRTATAVSLRWDDNANNEDYYRIERSTNGVNYTQAGDIASSRICSLPLSRGFFIDTGLSPGTAYQYKVTAVNGAGNSVSTATASTTTLAATTQSIPDSRSWSATSTGGNGYTAVAIPKTPIGIRHLGGGFYEISDVALGTFTSSDYKETFYESGGQTMLAAPTTSTTIRNNGMGTWNGTTILTLKWKKCSEDKFETITLTPNALASDPTPAAPTGVQALVAGTNSIDISWATTFFEKDYIVERSPNGTTSFVQVGTNVAHPISKLNDIGPFVDGTTYYYRMRARNANNVSSINSSVISIVYRKPNFILTTGNAIANLSSITLGMYIGDFNNDGREDLMSLQNALTSSSTSQLVIFSNQGSGTFSQITPAIVPDQYLVASVVDINNDGNLDIGLGVSEKNQFDIYFGNGDFTFTKATSAQMGDIANIAIEVLSSSWADVNNDGRLDVLILPNSSSGNPLLFKQTAGGSFSQITGGPDVLADVCTCNTGLWADYNNDGYSDFVITYASGAWRLFQNNKDETFTNKTSAAGLTATSGFSGVWGDYNTDGTLDLFVGNTTENALFKNNGDGTFTKEATTAISTATQLYADAFGDFNNDGLLDLIGTSIGTVPAKLFINTSSGGTTSFQAITTEKVNDANISHYGVATGDIDGNGFLDLAMSSIGYSATSGFGKTNQTLFSNNNSTGNWIEVKLVGIASNRSAIGARVTVTAGGKTYVREVTSMSSFASKPSFIQHFGIGGAASITTLKVEWPSGIDQTLTNPTINQLLTITEDGGGPGPALYAPLNAATGVNTNTIVEITFNEPATAVAGKKLTLTGTGDASPTYSIDVNAATVTGGTKFTFTLPSRLLSNKHYDIGLEQGAVVDQFANPSLAITSGWGFTTAQGPVFSTLSPANGATTVAGNAALEITTDMPITAVAGKKIKVMNGAATVLDVAVSLSGSVTGSKYTLPAPSAGWPYSAVLTVTLDGGAFIDVNSHDTDPISGSQWSFTVMEAPDATGPVFGDMSGLPTSVGKANLAQSFSITITDNKGVTTARIFSKAASAVDFTLTEGTVSTGNAWQFAIAASAFDATGVQYFFRASDAAGNITRSPAVGTYQTLIKYKGNEAQVPAALIGAGGTKAGWKVISIPFELGANNGVLSILDELATSEVKVAWRFLSLQPDPTKWLDYPDGFGTIDRGKGYFINIITPPAIIVGNELVAPGNTRDNLFKISLKKGWNMIGNPYLEAIDWANAVTLNSLSATAVFFKKYVNGQYTNVTALAAYEGGFVQVPADVQVSIPFLGQNASPGRTTDTKFDEGEWVLPITLQQNTTVNTFGGVGMHKEAQLSVDRLDDINAPRFLDFNEMNFAHPEVLGGSLARDVVPVASEFTWKFTVASSLEEIATFTWDAGMINIGSADLFLFDETTQAIVNMKEVNRYSFDPRSSADFGIYFGENARAKITPKRVTLGAAYPNPTSNVTTVPFSIPEKNGKLSVRLEVFDATGRKVSTLANGEFGPGFYNGQWEPHEGLSNGLYFYRLLAGDEVLTGKVVLRK